MPDVAFVKEFADATNTGNVATISTSTDVTAGDLILVYLSWDTTDDIQSIGDNAAGGSNSYTQIGSILTASFNGDASHRTAMWWAKAKATETLTITVTIVPNAGVTWEIYGAEWSGQDPTAPINDFNNDNHDGAAAQPTISLNTTVDRCGVYSVAVPTAGDPGVPAGYTSQSTFDNNRAVSRTAVVTPAGAETITYPNSIGSWHAWGVAIRPPSAAVTARPWVE